MAVRGALVAAAATILIHVGHIPGDADHHAVGRLDRGPRAPPVSASRLNSQGMRLTREPTLTLRARIHTLALAQRLITGR
jgi:hypothetical protein